MKFLSIHIQNFLAIGHAEITLADRGLVLLQGVNEDDTSADSNGSGKSSIADALCWTLYGTTARGEEGDKVVNRTAGKDCCVSVTIDDDGTLYRIARHRKHKTAKNGLTVFKDGGLVDLTKGTDKLTQAVVRGIIGSSYEVFRSSIYAGQESFPDLPSMTDKQLKVLVEEASGVTILEKAYEEARERASEVKERHGKVTAARERIGERLHDIRRDQEEAEHRKAAYETERAKAVVDRTAAVRAHVDAAKALDTTIATYDEPAIRSAMAECDAAIASVKSEVAKERKLSEELGVAAREESALRAKLTGLGETFKRQAQAVKDVEHQVGCPCDGCGRPLTSAEIAPTKAARLKAAQDTRASFDNVKADAERAIAAHKTSAEALSAFRASMTDVSEKSAQRASHERELMAVLDHMRRRGELVSRAKETNERIKDVKVRPNPFADEIVRLDGQIEAAEFEQASLIERKDEIAKELKVAEVAVSVFSPAGVRAHILDTVTPFLNERTAKYLSILSDDNIEATWSTLIKSAKGELRERFAIEVTSRTGGERFASVSGGEKRKVRIAAALALQDLVSNRATKPIELFVGDEIDDALDNAGLERLMSILEDKARERGSVFVISHRDLKSWIPNTLLVRKSGGVASVIETVE